MDVNNRIREQVITDLSSIKFINRFFNGIPVSIEVPEDEDSLGELPALSVSISDGEPVDDDFDSITWRSSLIIKIYAVADNDVDTLLDSIAARVLDVIKTDYCANHILSLCNRSGFAYQRDEEQPWGTLDLIFTVEYEETL